MEMFTFRYLATVSALILFALNSSHAQCTAPVVTASPSSQTICSGDTTSISLSSNIASTAYNWSVVQSGVIGASSGPGISINQTLTTTGSSAGTAVYTITPSSNGCTGNPITVTITVNPIPAAPTITGSNNVCSGGIYCVPSTYQTYSWTVNPVTAITSISGNSTNCATINWNQSAIPSTGAVITVTNNGCAATSTYTVYRSCQGNPAPLTFCNTNTTQIWSNSTTYNGTSAGTILTNNSGVITVNTQFTNCNQNSSNNFIVIDGTFIVNSSLTIKSSNIVLSPDAKIIVQAPHTLTIEQGTWLHACGNTMWDGIYVNSGAKLIIQKNSLIEDAKNAVVSTNGGLYTVNSSIFNKNFKDIIVQPFSGVHPGTITNSIFTCRNIPVCQNASPIPTIASIMPSSSNTTLSTYASASLLTPYIGRKTRAGVEVTDVTSITVDLPTSSTPTSGVTTYDYNAFDNLEVGIASTNSNIIIKDNWFQNITQPSPLSCCTFNTCSGIVCNSPPRGVAIWAVGNPLEALTKSLLVGNLNIPEHINFFNSCTIGILAETNMSAAIYHTEMNNFIQNSGTFSTGILVQNASNNNVSIIRNRLMKFHRGIHCKSITKNVKVNFNTLHTAVGTVRRGIILQNVGPLCLFGCPPHIEEVKYNTITDVNTGILLMQSPGINIAINNIKYTPTSSGNICGIQIQSSIVTVTDNNSVTRAGNPNSNIVNSVLGISIETGSGGSRVTNNTLTRMGTGIRCLGNTASSTLSCNTMQNCWYEIGLSSSTVGTQGSASQPSDNKWTGNYTSTNPRIYSNSLGAVPNWYYRNGITFNVNPFTSFGITPILVSGNPPSNCSAGGPPGNPNAAQVALSPVVTNQLQYTNLASENKWIAKKGAFTQIMQDTAVLYAGTADDTAFQNFYTTMQTTNNRQIVQINNLVAERDLQTAQMMNDALVPTNLIETNWQQTNAIYISKLQNNDFTLDTLERNILWSIAPQNPMEGGDGVYLARILLDVNYDDVDAGTRTMFAENNNVYPESGIFNLYPNPNDGNMVLDYSLLNENDKAELALYDITGKLLFRYELNASENQLAISHKGLNNGIYLYKIKVNEQVVKSDKLIIIK